MKKISVIIIVFLALSIPGWTQNIQWAFNILEYSSQMGVKDYAAIQAIGKPNVFPAIGENIKAWQPVKDENESFLKVAFFTPVKPRQIIVSESLNPGYITGVYVYDAQGKEHKIENVKKMQKLAGRFLYINTSYLEYEVTAVKIILHHENIQVALDAIGITESDKAYKIRTNPTDVIKANMVATRLSNTVNSQYAEMGPLVSPDGKTLYYSRRGDPADAGGIQDEEDIWYSEWDETKQKWGPGKNMGAPLNNKYPNFVNSISPDGNTILLGNSYLPDGEMEDGVSMSQRTAAGWDTPKRLLIEDDNRNKSKMANYFMSNSQKILLISNDRKGDSFGDRDLYVCFVKSDNTWTRPLNLGKAINTKGVEAAPFLASDDRTLYFTSDGLNGYGGSDIYMSRRLDDSWLKWSEPENMGPVVNSSLDESYFTLSASANQVYFTSQSKKGNDVDMYKLTLPKILQPLPVMMVSGRVLNSKTNELVPGVRILFENLATGTEMGMANSGYDSARYKIILPSGSNYGYRASKEGYISVSSNIDLTALEDYKEYKRDLYITPIEVGETMVLNNIFFVFDKSELKKESFPELDRLVVLMKNNNKMRIEISANTDNVGTESYNDELSIKRAESVLNYLAVKSGIDKTRIGMKHYGELNPVATNTTAKGRQLNRRVEFKILSK
jgi:OOP family OmpA-OmpF porin